MILQRLYRLERTINRWLWFIAAYLLWIECVIIMTCPEKLEALLYWICIALAVWRANIHVTRLETTRWLIRYHEEAQRSL